VKKYLENENCGQWKLFFDAELKKYGGKAIWRGNLNKTDTRNLIRVSDPFVKELLAIWWYNSLMRMDGKPVFNREWFLEDTTKIKHSMDNSFTFLSPSSFENKYDLHLRPLIFVGIIAAARCPDVRRNTGSPSSGYHFFFSKFWKSAKPSKLIYNKLVSSKSKQPFRSQGKWCREICP